MRLITSRSRRGTMASAFVLCAALAATACGGGGGATGPNPGNGGNAGGGGVTPTGPVSTTSVTIKGFAFDPPAIVVAKGATVTFTNQDAVDHNATFDDATIGRSGTVSGSSSAALAMPATAGTYTYHCTIHPSMTGSVTVQ